jgi:glycosyltransferase involved in cell wall biosynthesis
MGLSVAVSQLARAQARKGIVDPVVLVASEPGSSLLHLESVPVIRFPSPARGLPRYVAHLGACLRLDLVEGGFDLVHGHGQRAAYLLAALRRRRKGGWDNIPLVYTCHGWLNNTARRRLGLRLELGCYRFFDAVLACSPHQVVRLEELGVPTTVGQVLNGIEPPQVPPAGDRELLRRWLRVPEDAELIGNVGRLSSEKRQDVFLRASRLIAAHRQGAYFLIVGHGRERARLEALARSLGIIDRVRFTGFMSNSALLVHELALLLHTSDAEACPIVVIEAMAMGVPVVATRVGGVPFLIQDGVHGRLGPAGDAETLARHALEILARPSEREAIICQARRRFEQELSIETMRQGTERLYLETLGRRRRGADTKADTK